MKISLNWIKDYVVPGIPADELARRLTMAGLEVEKSETVGGDTVFEFEITPNRPDCLNMIGLAREISAVLKKPLILPKITARKFPAKKCDVTIEASEACTRYIGTVIEGVKISPAPAQLRKRLVALGSRPISNVVDITNYCLFEIGQPLHAFDLDKLEGKKIVVRFAKKGEKIVTLDGIERELDPSVLVIADARKPVALAGIMGGANSEVTENTKNILLESACFDPVLIRRTARKLGLSSDSSYRFERGVVFEYVATGANRAVDLILESAGGTVISRSDVMGLNPTRRFLKTVTLNLEKMNAFLGAKVPQTEAKRILKALGFSFTTGKASALKVKPPVFRPDVQRPEDLYEEIARVLGYNNLPSSFPCVKMTGMNSNQSRKKRHEIAERLLSLGFSEVLTYTLINREQAVNAGVSNLSFMKVLNPLSKDQEALRPHLLPSLLQAAKTNLNHGQKDLMIFETGKAYPHGGEREELGILLTGDAAHDWRISGARTVDFYDLKGAVEIAVGPFVSGDIIFKVSEEQFLEEGQRADVFVGQPEDTSGKASSKKIGVCGKVGSQVLEQNGIRQDNVFFAQIDLEVVYALTKKEKAYVPACEFPGIARDVSIAVSKNIFFDEICRVVRQFGGEFLRTIQLKEQYLGEKIPADQRGLVFSVVYQAPDRTLTEEEIQTVHENVLRKLIERLGALIR
ncbi:MAG: phenylalanine--tRNA ligase subunit beta [Candidatus Omnitrophota bacterium]